MAKDISRSMRMTQEVFDYVDSFNGNGFNDKFEKLVYHVKDDESGRKKRIKDLDKLIVQREKQLGDLYKQVSEMNDLIRNLGCLQAQLLQVSSQFEKVTQSDAAAV